MVTACRQYLNVHRTSMDRPLRLSERPRRRCDGTWGLAILNKADPDNIVVACNGSPMVIGLAQGEIFVASETAAFNRHTKNFIAMKV